MKAYRAKQRQLKKDVGKDHKAISTLTDAIRARKAKKELLSLATEKANKTANQAPKKKRGRPAKSQQIIFVF